MGDDLFKSNTSSEKVNRDRLIATLSQIALDNYFKEHPDDSIETILTKLIEQCGFVMSKKHYPQLKDFAPLRALRGFAPKPQQGRRPCTPQGERGSP